MRILILLPVLLGLASPALAQGRERHDANDRHQRSEDRGERPGLGRLREQDNAYRAMQQGRIRPLPEIRARINIPGAEFIGVEFDGRIYRLKYMRGGEVIWIDIDASTGQILRRQ